MDAKTKEVVGWISSNTDVNQTSVSWDTRSVFLTRGSGYQKDIKPGSYFIKIVFDNKNWATIQGGTFQVVQ